MEKFTYFIASLRWQDIADIVINSYILFRFYILFRETYVFRVLIGMTVLWFFQRLAVSLGLVVTSWVIQGIVALAAFIIIVIFRNEIRSVLQAKNLKTILWGISTKTAITPVEIVSSAVFEMAKKKCGALIVFQGKEDLSEILKSGIPWNGSLTKEMIMSIFWPDNPVHDGAALIQGDQVVEVGSILPLSRREDLPSYYGTRHRAALGLAESTDAIVLIVSEERGDVLLAIGSRLTVVTHKRDLERLLYKHLIGVKKKDKYVKRERFEIITAALFSIVFISGVWFSVSRGLDTLINLEIPVEYMNRQPGMEIVNTSVNKVNLELSGSGALVKSIRPEQIQIKLDLSKAVVGDNSFTITPDHISIPPGIIIKNVIPQEVDVDLDITVKKEVPVQVDWVGRLPDNVFLSEVKIEPPTVIVLGGRRIIENLATIYTVKVSVDKLKKSGTLTANLALNPASLKIAPQSKDKITIRYKTEERLFDNNF